MTPKTIDELAGLIMYMDDLITCDENQAPHYYIQNRKIEFHRDYKTPNDAIKAFKKDVHIMETEECWKNGKHMGDCIKVPSTCMRCLVEDYRERAKKLVKYFEIN